MRIAGVDGCRRGWVVVDAVLEDERIVAWSCRVVADIDGIFAEGAVRVAIDIPIGLLEVRERGGRVCDRQTRKQLGKRASSVFSPPVRPILGAESYDEVRRKGLSIQAFHIMPKIAAVDGWITPERQRSLIEAHPELAFTGLAGQPMRHNKKKRAGFSERVALLEPHLPGFSEWAARIHYPRKEVARDDLVDAAVMTLVARDHLLGRASCLPEAPPRDARGLEMAIWSVASATAP